MVRYRRCAVQGCENVQSSRHGFPDPKIYPKVFLKWKSACGNKELNALSSEEVFRRKKVCHVHFTAADVSSNTYLRKGCVPSMFLPSDRNTVSISLTNTSLTDLIQDIAIASTSRTPTPVPAKDNSFSKAVENVAVASTSKITSLCSPAKGHKSLLREVGIRKSSELSPRARKFYYKTKSLTRSVKRLRKKFTFYENQMRRLTRKDLIYKVTAPLDPHVASFVRCQLHAIGKAPKGRRYTTEDKILGLILYKQCGHSYRHFRNFFVVPSVQTVKYYLQKISIMPGINNCILQNLKINLSVMPPMAKYCIVMFDEIRIEPHISLNVPLKEFEGFENFSDARTHFIADHALVFMLKGIFIEWKQPFAYILIKGTTKTIHLVRILKNVIKNCFEVGLKVTATVSDQGATNQAAVNYLVQAVNHSEPSHLKSYFINDNRIIHIYDPPHLLKGIRNSLLRKNLIWVTKQGLLKAKWSNIYNSYLLDNASGELRTMPKLTEEHCNPEKIKKMRVSCAAQVFSHSVVSVMMLFARTGFEGINGVKLDESAVETAKILKFFDSLFDSVNGHTLYGKCGKDLRCAISDTSQHATFFTEAKEALQNMYFEEESSKKKSVPPSLRNWLVTINGIQELVSSLKKEGFSFIKPRVFNQDPLENFFAQLRQRGGRNVNPTPTMFRSHFKTLIINNITKHPTTANCERDTSFILSALKNIINNSSSNEEVEVEEDIDIIIPNAVVSVLDLHSISYISGYLTRKIRMLQQCEICKQNLLCKNKMEQWHDFVAAKEFADKIPLRLKYATPELIWGLCKIYNMLKILLPQFAPKALTK